MDNSHSPAEHGPQDRTQPYRLGQDGLPEIPPAGYPHGQDGPRPPRGRPGRTTRWAAGAGIAALLIGCGSFLGVELASAGRSPAATQALPAAGSQTVSTAQAGALTAMLGDPAAVSANLVFGDPASSSAPAGAARPLRRCAAAARHLLGAGHRAAAVARWRSCARHLLLLRRLLLHAVHGQVTFQTRNGPRTIAFERGVLQSVSGSAIVVRASDGTTWTWDLIGKTVVVRAGHRVGTSALAAGERVFAAGQVLSGADDARLIVIHR